MTSKKCIKSFEVAIKKCKGLSKGSKDALKKCIKVVMCGPKVKR